MSEKEKRNIKFVDEIPGENKKPIQFTIKGENGETISFTDPDILIEQVAKGDVSIRDENVQEILTKPPHWMIRWGNILLLFLVLLILFLSWLIKYPDTVSDSVLIEKSPDNKNYIGIISSKNYAFQKVKKGQKAQISMLVYPEYENGILLGVVDTIFWNKSSKLYITKINLSKNLTTTYGIKINPETNLEGLATVVIKDKRLIENFFRLK